MNANHLVFLSITEALKGLHEKKWSSHELVQAHLERIEETQPLNAFLTVTADSALEAARHADENRAQGHAFLLEGIPIAHKDLFCTKGIRTTAASKILGSFVPPYESTVSQKLKDSGAICLGKTNLDEFAMGSTTTTSAFGPTLSPWRNGRGEPCVPGGSSGGSAAAVASFSAMGATGTDTGGSIRQPASFSGLVGLKPTYGRCSRFGIIAFASSLDQPGPLTRTVEDAALMLQSMAGYDPQDSTSINCPVPDYQKAVGQSIKGLRVGIHKECAEGGLADDVARLWQYSADVLREAGAHVCEVSLPHLSYSVPVYYIIAPAEASSNLARYDGVRYGVRVDGNNLNHMYEKTRGAGFGKEVKRRILVGTYVLSVGYYDAYYVQAQKVRQLIVQDFKKAYEQVDLLLMPTAPTAAYSLADEPKDPVTMYMNDIFTVPASLAGLPGISIPMGLSDQEKLPLGMQLVAPAFQEETLLSAGQVLFTGAQKDPVAALREING